MDSIWLLLVNIIVFSHISCATPVSRPVPGSQWPLSKYLLGKLHTDALFFCVFFVVGGGDFYTMLSAVLGFEEVPKSPGGSDR